MKIDITLILDKIGAEISFEAKEKLSFLEKIVDPRLAKLKELIFLK